MIILLRTTSSYLTPSLWSYCLFQPSPPCHSSHFNKFSFSSCHYVLYLQGICSVNMGIRDGLLLCKSFYRNPGGRLSEIEKTAIHHPPNAPNHFHKLSMVNTSAVIPVAHPNLSLISPLLLPPMVILTSFSNAIFSVPLHPPSQKPILYFPLHYHHLPSWSSHFEIYPKGEPQHSLIWFLHLQSAPPSFLNHIPPLFSLSTSCQN